MPNSVGPVIHGGSLLTEHDIYLFREGSHFRLWEVLGAHLHRQQGLSGTHFAVWAPAAESVSVVADFNAWDTQAHPLAARWDESGIWEGFIPGVKEGALYKYFIVSEGRPQGQNKSDPFAFRAECPPGTASQVWDLKYEWGDDEWIKGRSRRMSDRAPWSIYEVHAGSWKRVPEENLRLLSYPELESSLGDYLQDMGFTHLELLPMTEHPFFGSWGYQSLGFFAPTSRYGSPQQFMSLIDGLHRRGIGVILDWVPSHFPMDAHGLGDFDGTHLYEHSDPRQGYHPDWSSYIFNYGRHEVRAFLISSALFWVNLYHVDALRVDAVASMLYLDYSREEGEWLPNPYGGKENLEAIAFLRALNHALHRSQPSARTLAEESTAWPGVTSPDESGGLGFDYKWKMGWMHDTLSYLSQDPIYRKYIHDKITFSMWYAYAERFVLPLSHDEVVHGKGSLLGKMPGDEWQKMSNLRLLFGHLYSHPGKKLLFMGGEFGQLSEWNHDGSLDWHVLDQPLHQGLQKWVRDLNRLYRRKKALHAWDSQPNGFSWIIFEDRTQSVFAYLRRAKGQEIVVVCNFTPVPRDDYRLGVPGEAEEWEEILNSDAERYGGSGIVNRQALATEVHPSHDYARSLRLRLPPLAVVFLSPIKKAKNPGLAE